MTTRDKAKYVRVYSYNTTTTGWGPYPTFRMWGWAASSLGQLVSGGFWWLPAKPLGPKGSGGSGLRD